MQFTRERRQSTTTTKRSTGLVVEAKGLHKAYGKKLAVAGIDLAVRPGEIFGLLGPNGAGKT
ncbi:MAG: hypothetical protein ACRDJL_09335, partial [Actinomycetota bacterium]